MKVSVEEDKCVAAGQCVMVAPQIFDQRDDDGVAIVLVAEPGPDQHDVVREAALVCPAAAIRVLDS